MRQPGMKSGWRTQCLRPVVYGTRGEEGACTENFASCGAQADINEAYSKRQRSRFLRRYSRTDDHPTDRKISARWGPRRKTSARNATVGMTNLQPEQLAEAFRLGTADGDFGLLLVIHAELVGALEPGHDFLDPVDIDHV